MESHLNNFNILVLDDDEEIRNVISIYLGKKFKNIMQAGDSITALEILTKNQIDVLLSDIHLPGADGVELFHVIKNLVPPIPKIIFISGDLNYKRDDALANGAIELYHKPFNGPELVDAISKTIGSILIVTDDEEKSEQTNQVLQKEGYFVRLQPVGEAAGVLKDIKNFDVVYFDLNSYSDENWKQFVFKTREKYSMFELPILITCNKELVDEVAESNLEINDFLPRYFDIEFNLTKLKNIILAKRRDEELNFSKHKAIENTKLKSMFLANMSHEIRTPLNGIIGVVSMLEDTKLDPEQTELVSIVKNSSFRLQKILNDILDFSKIESKNVTLDSEVFDLHDLVHQIYMLFLSNAQKKGLELITDIDASVPRYIKSDAFRLQQIITNYINNALKFTEKGSVTIRLSIRDLKVNDAEIYFEIIDTGIGLSKEETSRLFKSFSQANYSTTKVYGGTGLGLSICKQLVTLFDGDAGVQSKKGKGSTFWFKASLPPASTQEADAFIQSIAAHKAKQSTEKSYENKKILVVDDDEVNRKVLEKMLIKSKVPADFADSGQKALDMAKSFAYDLIFLDCHMPEMDGYETAEKMRDTLTNMPPIVAFTADAFAENKEKCHQCGMKDFATKPITISQVLKILRKWL